MELIVSAGVILGALLALRFKVLVLVPVLLMGILLITGVGIGQNKGFWWTTLGVVLGSIGLQAGYLIGGLSLSAVNAVRPRLSGLLRTRAENSSL
jgi:hypothetical protein